MPLTVAEIGGTRNGGQTPLHTQTATRVDCPVRIFPTGTGGHEPADGLGSREATLTHNRDFYPHFHGEVLIPNRQCGGNRHGLARNPCKTKGIACGTIPKRKTCARGCRAGLCDLKRRGRLKLPPVSSKRRILPLIGINRTGPHHLPVPVFQGKLQIPRPYGHV